MTYAKVVADSVSDQGHRLTTMEVEFHRFVLAEFNTHRVFSRNSASSRAIPVHKQRERIVSGPATPVKWATEQKGMQGGDELEDTQHVEDVWRSARLAALDHADMLTEAGVHKSIVNRLLEPFMWHRVIVTSTAWENFFNQRVSPLAQPEIAKAASLMWAAYASSEPQLLPEGKWHLPYTDDADVGDLTMPEQIKISVARCARVSYLTHDGVRSPGADLNLYDRLVSADPMHASPLEHVATPDSWNIRTEIAKHPYYAELRLPRVGNFVGWRQHRFDVEIEKGISSYA